MNRGTETGPAADFPVGQALGEVVWLMSRSPSHQAVALGALDWLVVPAIKLNQFRLYRLDNKPWGYVSWAFLGAEALERVRGGNVQLSAADWRSGDELFLVDLVAPFGGMQELVGRLVGEFPNQPLKSIARESDGTVRFGELRQARKPKDDE